MLAPILLATVLAARVQHLPVHQAAQPVVVSHEVPQKMEDSSLKIFAYCDASRQSWVTATNAGPAALVVEWTVTATMPGYPQDRWSGVSRVEPGQFEGWMSPAPSLHLDIRYDDDGLPTTNSIDAYCPATTGLVRGLEEY